MKIRSKLLIMLFAALSMTFSCDKVQEPDEPQVENPDDETEEDNTEQTDPSIWDGSAVSFSIGAEDPVVWSAGDVVKVFDADFVRVEFTAASAGNPTSFTSSKWTGYRPAYAVFSNGIQYCDTDEGIIKYVELPSEQKLTGEENYVRSALPAVGKVEEDEELDYKISSMKNLAARIAFTFIDSKTKSLKIEGLDGEVIAGTGNVKYDDLSWTPKEDASETVVTLLPSGETFDAGSTVYACILPGTFAKGYRVTITDSQDLEVVRSYFEEEGIDIVRNSDVILPDAIDTPQSQWKSSVVNFMVGAEAPFAWSSGDAIKVFDDNSAGVIFTTDALSTPAVFSTTEWTGNKPVFAAYSGETATYDCQTGVAMLNLPIQQRLSDGKNADNKAMPAISVIADDVNEDYNIESMTNVAGRIALRFLADTKVKSVKVQGVNNEPLAGSFKYDVASQIISEASETVVTLTPSGETFEGGSTAYVAVLPGTYPNGIKVTMTMTDNSLLTKTYGEDGGIVVSRNQDVSLPEAIDTPAVSFPEEFVVSLNLAKAWPFQESYSTGVNNYTYQYAEGLTMSFGFEGTYSYASGVNFTAAAGKLVLPKIDGRYLNSVVVVHEANGSKKLELHKLSDDSQIGNQYKTHTWKKPVPVAKFSPHTTDQCYVSLVDAMKITHVYLLYNSVADGADAVKLGFESQYNPYNNNNGEGDGAVYVLDVVNGSNKSPFVGISYTKSNGWDTATTPNPYIFTQTVDGVSYTFESLRPNEWEEHGQHMFCWSSGMYTCNWGTPNKLKLPRTGKLVWAAACCNNAYAAGKNRTLSIETMDQGDGDYTVVGEVTHVASAAKGTGDGTSDVNSAAYKAWCLDDAYSPTKDYYLSAGAGNTWISFLVLVYL